MGVPISFSYRETGILPPVGDQKECGCCVMFACTSAFTSIHANQSKGNKPANIVLFSKQQIIDRLPDMYPLDENSEVDANECYATTIPMVLSYVDTYGLCRECDYPYVYKRRSQSETDAYINEHKYLTLGKYNTRLDSYTEEAVLAHIYINPIVGIIPSYQTLMDFKGNGIYMDPTDTEELEGYHAVLITGYGIEKGIKYYEIQNSWGTGWGDAGFGKLERSLFMNLTAVYGVYCKQ